MSRSLASKKEETSTISTDLKKRNSLFSYLKNNYDMYLFLVPGLIFLAIFKFAPMWYILIAFKDYNIMDGFANSPWVGLKHFEAMFGNSEFYRVLKNTLLINFYKILIEIPVPVFLAILINEVSNRLFKKVVQTAIYIPYFINWIIIYGVFYIVLGGDGIINQGIKALGGNPIYFFIDKNYFRSLLVITDIWWYAGWGTVIYLSAISGIDQEMYEAAVVDGANRFKQMIHITLPSILPTIVLVLVIRLGYMLTGSFDQVLAFYNPNVYETGDIIGTYVYRQGLGQMEFSYSTTIGLFNSVVGIAMVIGANTLSRKILNRSIW